MRLTDQPHRLLMALNLLEDLLRPDLDGLAIKPAAALVLAASKYQCDPGAIALLAWQRSRAALQARAALAQAGADVRHADEK